MGLFALALKGDREDLAKSALCNLKLFLEDGCSERSNYLVDLAHLQISELKKSEDDSREQ